MSDLSLRELYLMGFFDSIPKNNISSKGRIIKKPRRFINRKFVKGSGVAKRPNRDRTDMRY